MLPEAVKDSLIGHLGRVRRLHEQDLKHGVGRVALPDALVRRYPNAERDWGWQYVFPASSRYFDRAAGFERRHHLHESVIQKAMKQAVHDANITKPATCHTLRHYAEFRTMPSSPGMNPLNPMMVGLR